MKGQNIMLTISNYIKVLNCLGVGPTGPAVPPAANFSVVPFPVKRHAPPGAEGGHYMFIAASPDDP